MAAVGLKVGDRPSAWLVRGLGGEQLRPGELEADRFRDLNMEKLSFGRCVKWQVARLPVQGLSCLLRLKLIPRPPVQVSGPWIPNFADLQIFRSSDHQNIRS
mmetsp:Transcript_38302/g.59795  ORF Transcript_38302/g.59795 Transcript_38302/m.59795 type:complete len:102 (-) Transcript_38302:244-549(-)